MHPISRLETRPGDLGATFKLRALVADLQLRISVLDTDIQEEERRTGTSDVASVAYPILARNLRTRRDNLLATVKVLERHLADADVAARAA